MCTNWPHTRVHAGDRRSISLWLSWTQEQCSSSSDPRSLLLLLLLFFLPVSSSSPFPLLQALAGTPPVCPPPSLPPPPLPPPDPLYPRHHHLGPPPHSHSRPAEGKPMGVYHWEAFILSQFWARPISGYISDCGSQQSRYVKPSLPLWRKLLTEKRY